MSKQKQKNNFCTQHVLNLYFSCNSMNNLSSYCGLTDSRMRASDTDLPVMNNIRKYFSTAVFHCFDLALIHTQDFNTIVMIKQYFF